MPSAGRCISQATAVYSWVLGVRTMQVNALLVVQSGGKSITQVARDLGIARRAPCITGVNSWRSRASRRFLGVGIRPLKKRSFAASNTSWKSCDRNATF